jgi:hypothetical protein
MGYADEVRRLLLILGLSVALFVAIGLFLGGLASRQFLARTGGTSPREIEDARRSAQAAALRRYLERRTQGTLLPGSDVTIAVREDFLQKVIASSLPFRQSFADGKYVARLDSVRVDLQDGLALVTLTGRGTLATDTTLFADLVLEGRLGIAGINDSTGQLTPRLEITNIQVLRAGPSTFRALTNPAVRYFGLQKVQEWNALQSTFHLPLKIQSNLKVPAVSGDVDLPEVHLPLAIRLSSVIALENRLVVSLRLLPESDTTAVGPEAPVRAWVLPDRSPKGLRYDRATVEALGDSVRSFAARDSLWRAVLLTDRDLVIITPRSVLSEMAFRMAHRYRAGADVDFRPGIHETIDEKITVKVLGAKLNAGKIHVDIRVNHLRGRLETPGEPRVRFRPPDALDVALPVRIRSAGGVATFYAKWDPSAIASMVCRGFETRQVLSGIVRPLTHDAHATIRFKLLGDKIVGVPTVQRDRLRLSFDLDDASWRKVRNVFDEQNRFGRCGVAMKPDSLVARLRRLGMKGVQIRLPADLLPVFELPVAFADVYEQDEVRVAAVAYRPELLVRPEYLRFGVDGDIRIVMVAPPDSGRIVPRPLPGSAPIPRLP